MNWGVILEYLKVFLSTQVISGVIIAAFIIIFKNDLRRLLGRIAKFRLPGGSEVTMSQTDREVVDPTRTEAPDVPENQDVKLPEGLVLSEEDVQKVRELFDAERATAYLWEYNFLNLFLVPNTQRVLDWFASLAQRTSERLYDVAWSPMISDAKERSVILEVLQRHHLIELGNGLIDVTPKGREYIQWRGELPA